MEYVEVPKSERQAEGKEDRGNLSDQEAAVCVSTASELLVGAFFFCCVLTCMDRI